MKRIATIFILFIALCSTNLSAQIDKTYFYWVGRNLLAEDQYREAIETINVLLRADDELHEGYFLRGLAKYYLGDNIGAEMDFSKAIALNPVYTNAFHYRGVVRGTIGNYDDATRDFQASIDLRPDLLHSYYSRGVTHLLNKQFEKAIADFDMVLRFTDKLAYAYIQKGNAYLFLNDTIAAHKNYDLAIKTNREDSEGYARRGNLLLTQNRYQEALEDYTMAVKNSPTYIMPLFNRAIVYSKLEQYQEGVADLDKIIELNPYYSSAYFNRALLYSQMDTLDKAIEDYNKVVEYLPENVLVYFNRAGVYSRLKQHRDAINDYTKAIELYPDFANAYIYRSFSRDALFDPEGAKEDREIAQHKIEEYQARLRDGTLSVYADTTHNFNQMQSFDSKIAEMKMDRVSKPDEVITLRPMYRFTLRNPQTETILTSGNYYAQKVNEFSDEINDSLFVLTNKDTDISNDSLMMFDKSFSKEQDWITLFKKGTTQSLIRQYTSAVNIYSSAIELNPSNPFLYINRATTRAEMIDFISSVNSDYSRISIDGNSVDSRPLSTHIYDYDNAIADLNKAAKLYPELAYIYYNRANLLALSEQLPEAFENYSKAIELNPYFADAYFNRGLVQIYMKDTHKGCFDISKAGELGIEEAYTVLKRFSSEVE